MNKASALTAPQRAVGVEEKQDCGDRALENELKRRGLPVIAEYRKGLKKRLRVDLRLAPTRRFACGVVGRWEVDLQLRMASFGIHQRQFGGDLDAAPDTSVQGGKKNIGAYVFVTIAGESKVDVRSIERR